MTLSIATDTDVIPPDPAPTDPALTNPVLTDPVLTDPVLTDPAPTELCRDLPGSLDLFFSEELSEIADAKRICAVCPAIVTCLEGAMRRAEPCGVWGGQLFERGRIVRIKRRRGRPPKHPRPEDQVPDLPIPEHLLDHHRGRRSLLTA